MWFGKVAVVFMALVWSSTGWAAEFRCPKQLHGKIIRGERIAEGDPKDHFFPFPDDNGWHFDESNGNKDHYIVCFYGADPEPSLIIKLPKYVKYCKYEIKNQPVVCR